MVRKSKEVSFMISLALHIGGLSLILYSGLRTYEKNRSNLEDISVSIISISEFDAYVSEDPKPSIQKIAYSNFQNSFQSAHEDSKFRYEIETDIPIINRKSLEILRNPDKRSKEFERRDTAQEFKPIERVPKERERSSRILIGFEEIGGLAQAFLPKDLVLRNGNSELLNSIQDKNTLPNRDVSFLKPDFLGDELMPAYQTAFVEPISNDLWKEVRPKDFDLPESRGNEIQLAKPKVFKGPKIFSKPEVNKQSEKPPLFSNKIQEISIPKLTQMSLITVTKEEKADVKQFDRSSRNAVQYSTSFYISSQKINQNSGLVGESLQKPSPSKDRNSTSVLKSTVEEPISSSWGAAIERKILSNLVYPKKARNNLLTGKVHLKLEIFADGTIISVLIRRSSGHVILDKAAKAAVLRSLKLPAAPNNYPNRKFIFNLPVRFSV